MSKLKTYTTVELMKIAGDLHEVERVLKERDLLRMQVESHEKYKGSRFAWVN